MDDSTEAAQYHADMLAYEKEARDALVKAHSLGLSEAECMAIAWVAGLTDFEKEIRK